MCESPIAQCQIHAFQSSDKKNWSPTFKFNLQLIITIGMQCLVTALA